MASQIFVGTAGADVFSAVGEGIYDTAVFRSISNGDHAIGGIGNDRFAASGTATVEGGGGNDQFFTVLNNSPSAAYTVVDGGDGIDQDVIIASGYQMNAANLAELGRLAHYLAGDTQTTHFVSDIFHLDMVRVETAWMILDGGNQQLAAVVPGPRAVADSYAATDTAVLHVDAAHGLLANDTALAGGLHAMAGTYATTLGGSVTVAADGSFDFTAHAGAGADTFDYTAVDSLGNTATATASVAVTHVSTGTSVNFEDPSFEPTQFYRYLPSTPLDYHGFSFTAADSSSQAEILNATYYTQLQPYDGHNIAFMQSGGFRMAKSDGSSFDLVSAQMTHESFYASGPAEVDGYVGTTLVHSMSVATTGQWQEVDLNWTGLTSAVFRAVTSVGTPARRATAGFRAQASAAILGRQEDRAA